MGREVADVLWAFGEAGHHLGPARAAVQLADPAVEAGEFWAKAEIKKPPPGSPYAGWSARPAEAPPPPIVPSG